MISLPRAGSLGPTQREIGFSFLCFLCELYAWCESAGSGALTVPGSSCIVRVYVGVGVSAVSRVLVLEEGRRREQPSSRVERLFFLSWLILPALLVEWSGSMG